MKFIPPDSRFISPPTASLLPSLSWRVAVFHQPRLINGGKSICESHRASAAKMLASFEMHLLEKKMSIQLKGVL